jgi:Anticodon binding domain
MWDYCWTGNSRVGSARQRDVLAGRVSLVMNGQDGTNAVAPHSAWSASDVEQILRDRGWLGGVETGGDRLCEWIRRASALLGPPAKTRAELAALLEPIFCYDARELLRRTEAQEVLARRGAREVIRELANQVLANGEIDSDRFKELIERIKLAVPYRSRALFHPIRLALAGRAGEGELDRVILLLDSGAKVEFAVRVKSVRERMIEFCAALD